VSPEPDLVERYLLLGLRVGRHLEGFVDAYYGPPELARRVQHEPLVPLPALVDEARHLVADLEPGAGAALEPARRTWLRAQVVGVHTSARKLAGEDIPFVDEVEACYGVRPERVPDDVLAAAHARLEDVLPGTGPLAERYGSWREAQAIPSEQLEPAIQSFAEDLRERTDRAFGLPDGEHVEWGLVTDEPWSGFNHYLGDLRSRVEINTDLPVLSPSLAHLVSHEAYPGHHTEHSRKEVGLVRRRQHLEETIFLVGTPQCVLAEGLADLGLEVLVGERPEPFAAEHLRPLGIPYDPEVAAAISIAGEALGAVRQNAALTMHQDGGSVDDAVDELERWALLPRKRAEQSVRFLTDPTWRAYISTYVEGLPRCRAFVGGDPERFERLLSEQLTPADLVASVPRGDG
jgi:hypothetical protein